MKTSFLRKVTLATSIFILMLASIAYGIMSARRLNLTYRVYIQLYQMKTKLFAKGEPGVWHKARNSTSADALDEEQRKVADNLSTLPYLKGYVSAPDVEKVTVYDKESAYNGFNFVVSAHAPKAFLMDMEGTILHEWQKDFQEVWPEPFPELFSVDRALGDTKSYWRRARLLSNGDLLAIFGDHGLIKLDKDSNLMWSFKKRCHHDMFESKDGNVYVLTREDITLEGLKYESLLFKSPILMDFITILSPTGEELRKISLMECFLNSEYASFLEYIKVPYDIFHTNTIRPIDGKLVNTYPMFKKGHLLISMRAIHTIAVVDPELEKITWALTGMWRFQHEPRLLENGNVLVYDNQGNRGKSKIVEVNPLTQEVVWAYKGRPASAFHSSVAGTHQRLANGNTLITESTHGRAFEVTRSGAIVWEFFNPYRSGENSELIAALYDVIRLDSKQLDWLTRNSE